MTMAEEMAEFVTEATFRDISTEALEQLKIRTLDALGCAIGAYGENTPNLVRKVETLFGGHGYCTLIGGGRTSPDRAAFVNGAFVRYLDFNDSFLAPGETCHPSDNVAPVLAASEFADSSGENYLVSLALAYQVQCRLSEVAPVRSKGFDHTTQGAYAVAAGVSKALGLNKSATANALAISGAALNALRVTRTGKLSNWKGLAYPFVSLAATHAAFLAKEGITGPLEVFEGNKGFMDSISGRFAIDWKKEDLELVKRTILKKYNSEVHSQSAVECLLGLKSRYSLQADQIKKIEVKIFDVAYKIIGGGEEGEKMSVSTKEEADHSLPYILAVALIDGEVTPAQYRKERIVANDVQTLLRKIRISPDVELSSKFPNAMPCEITVELNDGKVVEEKVDDYEGFLTRPMGWGLAIKKFERLSASIRPERSRKIVNIVRNLEHLRIRELTKELGGF